MPANTSPAFAIVGRDAEPSDAAIGALCRLLLAAADREIHTPTKDTPSQAASVASVFFSAATNGVEE